MENTYSYIAENIKRINSEIEETCVRFGRDPREVTLMGVSKTQPVEKIEAAYEAGIRLFGENRVQELVRKGDFFKEKRVPCHIIGGLQTNKVKYLPELTDTIHSVDSLKLGKEIDKQYSKHSMTANVLIEVNIGNEESKSGVRIEEAEDLIVRLSQLEGLRVKGLMCVPPICEGEEVRKYFEQMHRLFIDISSKNIYNVNMCILSMGMSDDFRWAIAEGSTIVRVGTRIFGPRNYNI